ncbi:conserved hypothetical protein [Vibrio chagasii]|nr:conserved hypothetical protein [Vibrio chagasii]|tara:strand:+ start:9925 stop:10188 length:264 start_codon:yes stop_codon:yes gene_type:complete
MYFIVDTKTQDVKAYGKQGDAARAALALLNVSTGQGKDPVKAFRELNSDAVAVLNLSDAFESVEQSDNHAAQELARSFKEAVEAFYG